MTRFLYDYGSMGLSEGGVPRGSDRAKAAIAKVAAIMKPRKRTPKQDDTAFTKPEPKEQAA